MEAEVEPSFVVAGAGSIGLFVGGALAHAGRRVSFLGRPRLDNELQAGLRLNDFKGLDLHLDRHRFEVSSDPSILNSGDLILVTVKSRDTDAIARIIANHARPNAVIVSLQNGLQNAERLRAYLPGWDVRGGMVAFNVAKIGPAHYHRGTSGKIAIARGVRDVSSAFHVPNLDVMWVDDIEAIQRGKLLLNLNNALNALSGLPLRDELLDREWRRLLADQIREALLVFKKAKLRALLTLPMPPQFLPAILNLPTPIFQALAGSMLRIDPLARSSMQDDLRAGHPTEVDELQGAVIAIAQKAGQAAPISQALWDLVKAAEQGASPRLTVADVRSRVLAANQNVFRDRAEPGL